MTKRTAPLALLLAPVLLAGCSTGTTYPTWPLQATYESWWSDEYNITTVWNVTNTWHEPATLTDEMTLVALGVNRTGKFTDVTTVTHNPAFPPQLNIHDPIFDTGERWEPGETKNATVILHVVRGAGLLRTGYLQLTIYYQYDAGGHPWRTSVVLPCKDVQNNLTIPKVCSEGHSGIAPKVR